MLGYKIKLNRYKKYFTTIIGICFNCDIISVVVSAIEIFSFKKKKKDLLNGSDQYNDGKIEIEL